MAELNLMDLYPRSKRPIDERAAAITDEHRRIGRLFGQDFFDGDRMYGYGGYSYNPRFWQDTVKRFRDHYNLAADARVLDVGSAKGFMLHDFKQLMPKLHISGIDISAYALENAMEDVKPFLRIGDCKELPYEDNSFDLVISINTVHNHALDDCTKSIKEIERVSKGNSFLIVDAWRNEDEKSQMMKWNLTGQTYMSVEDWKKLYADIGYTGDYYWFFAE